MAQQRTWPKLMDFAEWRESSRNKVDDDGSAEAVEAMSDAYAEYVAWWEDKYSWMR